jgi:hypothetical protein
MTLPAFGALALLAVGFLFGWGARSVSVAPPPKPAAVKARFLDRTDYAKIIPCRPADRL